MRRDQLAEALLSLVAPADRAASAVGDLMEEADARGGFWFWRSLTRLTLSLLGRDLLAAPLKMAIASAIAWFLYMGLSLVVAFVGYVIVTLVWGVAYVFANHTGLELLAVLLRVRLDWPPIPDWATYSIQAITFVAIAPFMLGRQVAPYWRGHELSLVLVMLLIWGSMSALVPFAGVGIRLTPAMVPIVVTFVLFGLVARRRSALT